MNQVVHILKKDLRHCWKEAGLALTLLASYQMLVERQYPFIAAEEPQPLRVALSSKQAPRTDIWTNLNRAVITLPMEFMPAPVAHSAVKLEGWRLTIVAPDGRQWNSGWRQVNGGPFSVPLYFHTETEFTTSRQFFEYVRSVPVKIRLAVAFTTLQEAHDRDVMRTAPPRSEFTVPGAGICRIASSYEIEVENVRLAD